VRTRIIRHGIVHLWATEIDENCDDSWGGLSPAFHDATENEEYLAIGPRGFIMQGLSNSSISLLYSIKAVGVSCIDTSGSSNSYINLTLWSMKQSEIEVKLGGKCLCLKGSQAVPARSSDIAAFERG
jgi:hypothetical protein